MADRGRRALPWNNRLCIERMNYDRVQKHYDALGETTSTSKLKKPWNVKMDTTRPESLDMKHLKFRAKKMQLEAERFAEIELENNNLLRKMTHIINNDPLTRRSDAGSLVSTPFLFRSVLQLKPGLRTDIGHYPQTASRNLAPRKSLNVVARRKELKRIETENSRMLDRIVAQKPFYSRTTWADQAKKDKQYLNNARSKEVRNITYNFSRHTLPTTGAYSQYMKRKTGSRAASAPPTRAPDQET